MAGLTFASLKRWKMAVTTVVGGPRTPSACGLGGGKSQRKWRRGSKEGKEMERTAFFAISFRHVGCWATSQSRKHAFKIPLSLGASWRSFFELSSFINEGMGWYVRSAVFMLG